MYTLPRILGTSVTHTPNKIPLLSAGDLLSFGQYSRESKIRPLAEACNEACVGISPADVWNREQVWRINVRGLC